jgi:hypothetical protein
MKATPKATPKEATDIQEKCQCSTASKEEMLREKDEFSGRWKNDWCHWCGKELATTDVASISQPRAKRKPPGLPGSSTDWVDGFDWRRDPTDLVYGFDWRRPDPADR